MRVLFVYDIGVGVTGWIVVDVCVVGCFVACVESGWVFVCLEYGFV